MAFPFVYFAGARLSRTELIAASLDGDLVALGEAFVPADVVESAALRAATLVEMLGDALAATHLTSAWVHGGIDGPPRRHAVQRAVPRRLAHVIDRRFVYRDPFVPPGDLVRLGGARVTGRGRTVADLARTPADEHEAALHAWARSCPEAIVEGLTWLRRHAALPHSRRAEALLASLRTT